VAQARAIGMNELVAELLTKALALKKPDAAEAPISVKQ